MELQVASSGYRENRRTLSVRSDEPYGRNEKQTVTFTVRYDDDRESESFSLSQQDARRLSNWLDMLADERTA